MRSLHVPKLGTIMPKMGISKTKRHAAPPARQGRAVPLRSNLAGALFSATQQRVLGLLFGQPERTFFTTELINLVGAGSGAVQRELRRLVDSGLVTVTSVGNQKHYQANVAAPIFEELRSIVTKTLGPAEVLRQALSSLADEVALAVLYGSVAKHTDSARSDIDVLIVSDALTLEQVYAALAPAEQQLGRRVSPTLYTEAEFRRRRAKGNPFLTRVFAGEHVVLMGEEDAFRAP